MKKIYKGVFLGERENHVGNVFGQSRREAVCKRVPCLPEIVGTHNYEQYKVELQDVEYAFSTWGMPAFSKEIIREYFPKLKIVFYAAGSVQGFARPFLDSGVKVLEMNRDKDAAGLCSRQSVLEGYPGNYAVKTGLIGAGAIGSIVAGKLKTINTEVLIYDPYITDGRAAELGAKKAGLLELFETCDVVSNHLPDIESTRGMLTYEHFSRMKPNAVFINSGRGRQLSEEDLYRALREGPGRTAILDVTHPEPPDMDSPLRTMPNVILTPHIDGSFGNEVWRMADYMIEELDSALAGKPFKHEVTAKMLEKMA